MKKPKKWLSIIVVMLISFISAGCNSTSSTSESETSTTEPVSKTFETETSTVETTASAADSEAEIMDSLWSELELHGFGIIYYPNCELSYIEENDIEYRLWDFDNGYEIIEYGIETYKNSNGDTEIRNKLKVTNNNKSKILYTIDGLGASDYTQEISERVFFQDLSGDGTDDMIIRIVTCISGCQFTETHILNGETLEEIAIPDNIYDQIYSTILSAKDFCSIDNESMEYNLYMQDGAITKHTISTQEYMEPEEMGLYDMETYEMSYVRDGVLFMGIEVPIDFGGEISLGGGALIYELKYDEKTSSFLLTDSYQLSGYNLDNYCVNGVMDEDLYNEAEAAWDDYRNGGYN